jgi:hypothetical protein
LSSHQPLCLSDCGVEGFRISLAVHLHQHWVLPALKTFLPVWFSVTIFLFWILVIMSDAKHHSCGEQMKNIWKCLGYVWV